MIVARVVAAAVAAACIAAPAASADPPVRTALDLSEPFTIDGACAFPVLVEELVNTTVLTEFSNGTQHFTGHLVIRLTNVSTEDALVVNVSGPGFFRVFRDGTSAFILGGRGLLIGSAEMLDPLDAQATLQSGRIAFRFDTAGEFVSASFIGRSTDLCAALA